ncbi:MAG: SusC/RagA family TonB-linked outer membrane protein [Culturomica sp.]|nr:SusC/RagA family TonB-linked outer membrane protein [Culturomica sp.]
MSVKTLKYIVVLLFCFPFGGQQLFAQATLIHGVVYENSKATTLPGASVILLNANNRIVGGTATDIDGKFKLSVPEGVVNISFSFIGLKTQTFPHTGQQMYEVILGSDENLLEQVVVTAEKRRANLGLLQQEWKDMTSAVTSVDMKTLEKQSVTTIDQLLQGAAPGLQVSFASGDPGAGASLRIRGVSSLQGDNSPLWIIDGAEMIGSDYNVADLENFGSSNNTIAGLDPNDIESLEVLKDASATALYGSRGANGVIVIRTKRGISGKPTFTVKATATGKWEADQIPLLSGDQQRMFVIEARANRLGGDNLGDANMAKLRGDMTRTDAWLFNNNTNMLDMLSRTGFTQNYSFSLRGGGERLNYYWSLGYDTEYGTTKGGGFNRFSTLLNLDYRLSDKLRISSKFSYSNTLTDKRSQEWPINGFNRWASVKLHPRALARNRAAFLPVYNQNGTEYYIWDEGSGGNVIPSIGTYMYNPIAMVDNATYEARSNNFTAQLNLDFAVNSKLNLTSMVAIDYRQTGNEFFAPSEALGVYQHHSSYNNGRRDDEYTMQLENKNTAIFRPLTEEKQNLTFTGVATFRYYLKESTYLTYNRSASSDLQESQAAVMIGSAGGLSTNTTSAEFVLHGSYRLLDRYVLNASLTTEGSSKFGKDNPFSIYPTVGFNWNLNEEAFLKDKEWIGLLKPRFSYGIAGKMPNIDAMLSVTYNTGANGYLGKPYTNISKFSNDQVREERKYEYNYGLDWELFNGRFSGEANYYTSTTKDLLVNELISTTTGWKNRMVNFGSLENKGFEVGFTVLPIRTDQLKWSLYYSISGNRNKLLEMPESLDESGGYTEDLGYGGFRSKVEVGSSISSIWGLRAKGVYARDEDAAVRDFNGNIVYNADGTAKMMTYSNGNTFIGGDMIYEDINRDGRIDELDIVQIGDASIGYFGTFRNTVTWKQWTLALNFYYSLDQDVINGARYDLEAMDSEKNQATSVLRRWRKQGDVTDMPRAEDYCVRNYTASTRWIEDASYLKLKEASLSYNVNPYFCQKIGFNSINLWLSGMNLFTWTKYKGIDPEISPDKGKLVKVGIDNQSTPTSRHFTVGLTATF